MSASGKAADSGLVIDALTKVNTSLGAKIKALKVNGTAATVTSGAVDLGTVITGVKDSGGNAITPTAAGVVTLPASTSVTIDSTDLSSIVTN